MHASKTTAAVLATTCTPKPVQLDEVWHQYKSARKQQGKLVAYTLSADLNQLLTILLDTANRWSWPGKLARYFSGLLSQLGKLLQLCALLEGYNTQICLAHDSGAACRLSHHELEHSSGRETQCV